MAVFELPTSITLGNYIEELSLDGVSFRYAFLFNDRDSSWFLNILDPDDVLLRAGIKVQNDFPLLRRWQEESRPLGEIFALRLGGGDAPAEIDELGQEVILNYIDADGLAELA